MNEWITIVLVPVARSVAGWFQNALKDGKITWPEWKQLGQTIIRIGLPAAALFYGFNVPIEFAVAIPLLIDYGFDWVKDLYKKFKLAKVEAENGK